MLSDHKHTPDQQPSHQDIPPYLTVYYVAKGKKERFWIGHIAHEDSRFYYSYEASTSASWRKHLLVQHRETKAVHRLAADDIANKNFRETYGDYSKIILPTNHLLATQLKIRDEITRSYRGTDYHVFSKNCAHLVEAHFVQIGMIRKTPTWLAPLYPTQVATQLIKAGRALIQQLLVDAKDDTTDYEPFIDSIQQDPRPFDPNNDLILSTLNEHFKKPSPEAFYGILQWLAEKHYSREEPQDFYAKWLAEALRACPIKPHYNLLTQPETFFEKVKKYSWLFAHGLGMIVGLSIATPIALAIAPIIPLKLKKKSSVNFKKLVFLIALGILLVALIATGYGAVIASAVGLGALTAGSSALVGSLGLTSCLTTLTGWSFLTMIGAWLGTSFYKFDTWIREASAPQLTKIASTNLLEKPEPKPSQNIQQPKKLISTFPAGPHTSLKNESSNTASRSKSLSDIMTHSSSHSSPGVNQEAPPRRSRSLSR